MSAERIAEIRTRLSVLRDVGRALLDRDGPRPHAPSRIPLLVVPRPLGVVPTDDRPDTDGATEIRRGYLTLIRYPKHPTPHTPLSLTSHPRQA